MFTDPPLVRRAAAPLAGIALCGINHRSAEIDLREQLALGESLAGETLDRLLTSPTVREAVLINTCNRVELVSAIEDFDTFKDDVTRLFSELSGISRASFQRQLYTLEGPQAVSHVFRVASGLDSLVVGEPQILGQVKSAFEFAHHRGTTSVLLNRLFSRAFGVAKAVRTRTAIGQNAVSVAFAARELARQIFGDLSEASVMLLGTGETGRLALKHFKSAGAKQIFVASRTLDRALEIANSCQGIPLAFEHVPQFIAQADVVIGASLLEANQTPLICADDVERSLLARPGKAQFFIDLGVPRNFDPKIDQLADAFLYNVDDLEQIVRQNLDSRAVEVVQAQSIVDDEVSKFCQWLEARSIDDAIRGVVEHSNIQRQQEIDKTMRRLRHSAELGEQELRSALEDLTKAVIAKTLHQPIQNLKAAGSADVPLLHSFLRLFSVKR